MRNVLGGLVRPGRLVPSLVCLLLVLLLASGSRALPPSGVLEIHTINVQQGGSHLIVGPDGTTVLMEAGFDGKGDAEVVPYLQSIGLMPADGLDYMIAGHQHSDHLGGLDEVIQAGYDVLNAVYYNGSSYSTSSVTGFFNAAQTTTAGPAIPLPIGAVIPLGNGARITCVAVNGQLIDGTAVPATNENDRSIALLVEYGGFDYLWASDLGGGADDNACTGRSTTQINVETPLLQAILPGGGHPLLSAAGLDVWHVNHHGSESSTNSEVMNLGRPELAIISTGAGQDTTWHHPRKDVVEKVLLVGAACIAAPPVLVLQTEEGSPTGTQTSFEGFAVGDILLATDGMSGYSIEASGQVSQGPDERTMAGLPAFFPLDEAAGPTPTPPPGSTPTPTGAPVPTATPTPTSTPPAPGDLSDVVINEYLPAAGTDWDGSGAFSANGDEWIELYNPSSLAVDLGGAKLDDISGGGTSPYTIPSGTILAAGGFRVFYGSTTGVALNNSGDTVQLLAPDGSTVIDSRVFGSSPSDRSEGRNPDGSGVWTTFTGPAPGGGPGQPSPGGPNAPAPAPTATPTPPPAPTATFTSTPTATFTSTPTATFTSTPTATFTSTPTATFTSTPTATPVPQPTSTPTPTALGAGHLLISEVYYDAVGADQNEEWLEIYNPTSAPLSLTGIKLGDEEARGGSEGMYSFPAGASIAAGDKIVVAQRATTFRNRYGFNPDFEIQASTSSVPDLTKYTSWASGDLALGNNGDEVLLLDAADAALDVVTFEGGSYPGVVAHPGVGTGHSIERSPAGQDTGNCAVDFVDRPAPSPGS